jgi:hypothetical protein
MRGTRSSPSFTSAHYFTHAEARRAAAVGHDAAPELRRLARFALWPTIGLASWAVCTFSGAEGPSPFLTAGLLGHYWLDGGIRTRGPGAWARCRSEGAASMRAAPCMRAPER